MVAMPHTCSKVWRSVVMVAQPGSMVHDAYMAIILENSTAGVILISFSLRTEVLT